MHEWVWLWLKPAKKENMGIGFAPFAAFGSKTLSSNKFHENLL